VIAGRFEKPAHEEKPAHKGRQHAVIAGRFEKPAHEKTPAYREYVVLKSTPSRPLVPWLFAAPAVILLVTLFLVPLVLLVRVSLFESGGGDGFYRPGTWSVRAYAELLGERFGRGLVAFTVALGVGVAALALAIGYPLALVIHSLPSRSRLIALGIVLLPKFANVSVVLYGMNLLLGNTGPVNRSLVLLGLVAEPIPLTHNLAGVIIAETYLVLPYAILVLVLSLGRIDPALAEAARGLGSSRWGAFRRVTWPLSMPGLALAGLLCLIWSLGAFVGPVLLGGPEQATLGVMVQKWGHEDGNWPRAAAAAVASLLTVGVCVLLYALPARRLRSMGATHA
jgi:ABC-type spermidine/putrescine transport system permease subunit I